MSLIVNLEGIKKQLEKYKGRTVRFYLDNCKELHMVQMEIKEVTDGDVSCIRQIGAIQEEVHICLHIIQGWRIE
jgi:hypothetical protein